MSNYKIRLANNLQKKVLEDFANQRVDTYTYELAEKYNQMCKEIPRLKNRIIFNLDRINYNIKN